MSNGVSSEPPKYIAFSQEDNIDPLDFSSLGERDLLQGPSYETCNGGGKNVEPELGEWFVDDEKVEVNAKALSLKESCSIATDSKRAASKSPVFELKKAKEQNDPIVVVVAAALSSETENMGNCHGPNLGQRPKRNSLITFDDKVKQKEYRPGSATKKVAETKSQVVHRSKAPPAESAAGTSAHAAVGGKTTVTTSERSSEDHQLTSVRSAESSGGVSVSSTGSKSARVEHSLRRWMTREQKDRDVYKYYEVLEVLGVGSMGSVSMVRKKRDLIGGSARLDVSQHSGRSGSSNGSENKDGKSPTRHRNRHSLLGILGGAQGALKQGDYELQGGERSLDDVHDEEKHDIVSSLSKDFSVGSKHSIPSDRDYKMTYALKTIHLNRISDPKFVEELRNEIEVLKSLDHPNIVRAIETFEQRNQLCIVMELCSGGDLYTRDPYTEAQARRIVRKLTHCVAYMHRCGVVHRDLKFENIMFENDKPEAEIKVLDFGLSKKYHPDNPHMHEGVGTIYTMAPQVLEGVYTSQADLWSIGVIAFMLLSSQMPFYGKKRRHVFEKIMQCRYRFAGARWEACSDESKDFVSKLLVKDPEKRLTAEQALRHPWFQGDYELVHAKSTVTDDLEKSARGSLERFANYSKLKRLALMVVAHKSTTDEIGHLRELFEHYDQERDGTVNLEEFKLALKSVGKNDADIERIFKAIDLDGSGLIHYTEFLAATIEARGIIVEERLAEAFDRLDSDDSGFISKDNLKEFLDKGFLGKSLTESYLFDIIDEVDITQDGMISYDEFLSLFEEHEETEIKTTLRDMNVQSISSELNSLASLSGTNDGLSSSDNGTTSHPINSQRSAASFVSSTLDDDAENAAGMKVEG